jgi:murein DD-endopeptidase MepM/ murein hydrolase activator NlpD
VAGPIAPVIVLARAFATALPFLLAGLLPIEVHDDQRWPYAGAWLNPVGGPYDFTAGGPDSTPGFRVHRNLVRGPAGHEGADLANGRGGDAVRAAANGLVVRAASTGYQGGYGTHVVIAHRSRDGRVRYSVYAHLVPGSLAARAGDAVLAGDVLGRIGASGRATTSHLHFEVRECRRADDRWENARPVDPVVFVAEHLPRARSDTTWARPYLEWAELAGLLASDDRGAALLTRDTWRSMLIFGTRTERNGPADLADPRAALVEAEVLPANAESTSTRPVPWDECTRELAAACAVGWRVPGPRVAVAAHRDACRSAFRNAHPADSLAMLGRRIDRPPTVAEACALLADSMLE